MITLLLSGISSQNRYCECSIDSHDIGICLESLNILIQLGWKIEKAKLHDQQTGSLLNLPVEAFDGQPIVKHLEKLQLEWEKLLS
jgi:hypothetical protein